MIMNKNDTHIINILKMHQKIDFEDNDNTIKMLVGFDKNKLTTGFEMFGDSYYNELEEVFEKELSDYANDIFEYDIIINTNKLDPKELYEKIGKFCKYDLTKCAEILNYCTEYKWIAIYDDEIEVYEDIFEILSNADFDCIDDSEYRENIVGKWNNYDLFDLGDFLYNYYPSDEILESEYSEIIINLLKEYKGICLEDPDFIKTINKKGFNL